MKILNRFQQSSARWTKSLLKQISAYITPIVKRTMPPENFKDIQQRLHELNAEEARLLADIQVSLAGIERIHAQRRMEELTLIELQRKTEDDRHEREDRKPRTQQGKQGKQRKQGQAGNKKRNVEERFRQPEPVKRQRRRGPSNAYGEQGIPVPIPGPSNHSNWNQRQNQPLPSDCKCPTVDIHCEGIGSMCAVCKALDCGDIAWRQSYYRHKRDREHHGNVPGVVSTWPHDATNVIDIDDNTEAMQG